MTSNAVMFALQALADLTPEELRGVLAELKPSRLHDRRVAMRFTAAQYAALEQWQDEGGYESLADAVRGRLFPK